MHKTIVLRFFKKWWLVQSKFGHRSNGDGDALMIFYKARAMPEIWENKKRRGERAENLEKDEIWFHAKRGRKRARKEERGEEGGSDPNSHSRRLKKSSMRRRYHFASLTLTTDWLYCENNWTDTHCYSTGHGLSQRDNVLSTKHNESYYGTHHLCFHRPFFLTFCYAE